MAQVHVFGGLLADRAQPLEIDAPRVKELIEALETQFPGLAGHMKNMAVAIDGEVYVDAPYRKLTQQSVIYFIPKITGG